MVHPSLRTGLWLLCLLGNHAAAADVDIWSTGPVTVVAEAGPFVEMCAVHLIAVNSGANSVDSVRLERACRNCFTVAPLVEEVVSPGSAARFLIAAPIGLGKRNHSVSTRLLANDSGDGTSLSVPLRIDIRRTTAMAIAPAVIRRVVGNKAFLNVRNCSDEGITVIVSPHQVDLSHSESAGWQTIALVSGEERIIGLPGNALKGVSAIEFVAFNSMGKRSVPIIVPIVD